MGYMNPLAEKAEAESFADWFLGEKAVIKLITHFYDADKSCNGL